MFSKYEANLRALDAIEGIGAAEVSLAFVAHPRGQVARAGAAVFDLPFGGQPETFLRPLMGLHLRHDCLPHFHSSIRRRADRLVIVTGLSCAKRGEPGNNTPSQGGVTQ